MSPIIVKDFPLFSGLQARNKAASATEYALLTGIPFARNASEASTGNMSDSSKNKLAHPKLRF